MSEFRCSVVFVCMMLGSNARAQDATVEFNRDIRPIFSDKCYTCHGPDAANRKTKLRLDIESGAKIELNKGHKTITPGDPQQSEIYRRGGSGGEGARTPAGCHGPEKHPET